MPDNLDLCRFSFPGPTGKVARKKGIGGGAIAAIVIVIILLVLIAVDIFCCFFNQCGAIHMCAAACAGRKREKCKLRLLFLYKFSKKWPSQIYNLGQLTSNVVCYCFNLRVAIFSSAKPL